MMDAVERLVVWLSRRHVEHYVFETSVSATEVELERLGALRSRGSEPPAIAFLDLTGYTALTEERGDEAAAELAARLGEAVEDAAASHGRHPVKWLGDGVMFHFSKPAGRSRRRWLSSSARPASGFRPRGWASTPAP